MLDTDVPMHEDKLICERIDHLLAPKFNCEWITLHQNEVPDLIIGMGEIDSQFSKIIQVIVNIELSTKNTQEIIEACEEILSRKRWKNYCYKPLYSVEGNRGNGFDGSLFSSPKK